MTRTIRQVFTNDDVQVILARFMVASRELEVIEGSPFHSELMSVVCKDSEGKPSVSQFRMEITVDVVDGSWKD